MAKNIFRHFREDFLNPYLNMAIDEGLLIAENEFNLKPSLRFYGWAPYTFSIGYFQSFKEVNLDAIKEEKAGFVRRPTGGRAVLHDIEVTYCVTIPKIHPVSKMSLVDSYEYICKGLIEGLKILGISAYLARGNNLGIQSTSCFSNPGLSDIMWNNKKIVGSAQRRNELGIIQHGSIIIKKDVNKIFKFINIDKEKKKDLIKKTEEHMADLIEATGENLTFKMVVEAMKEGFKKGMNIELEETDFTGKEKKLFEELVITKYSSDCWNFFR